MPIQVRIVLLIVVVGVVRPLPCAAEEAGTPQLHWEQKAEQSIALVGQDGVVWQFNFGAEQPKPYFHPLGLPGLAPLTVDRPPDHAWHHGLWFSWKFINGVNYWEHMPETQRPLGRTAWSDVHINPHPDSSADIVMELTYSLPDGPVVLKEHRKLFLSAPDELGQYWIDWRSDFQAGEADVTLACTPVPPAPGGVAHGGYGGLSIRYARELDERRASSAEQEAEFAGDGIHRSKSVAFDYNGLIAGREAGIAMLDHPDNPRHPIDWYAIRSDVMSYLNAAFMTYEPFDVPARGSFTLRYRLIVHPGRWDAAKLRSEYQEYAGR
ncbi:MAG: PmoA family protein [Planctomycetes bacterium]|nr:PmoA family protein [Planctomycetota bacterium]